MKTERNKKILIAIIVIHFILVFLTISGNLNFLFNDASLRKGKASDFFAVYQAGSNILENKSIYLDTEGESTPYSYPFRYLPFIGFTIGVLFTLFSPFIAYFIWVAICELILFFNISLLKKLTKNDDTFIIASIPWLMFAPYLIEIFMGQWSFVTASLLFHTIFGLMQKKDKYLLTFTLAPLIKPNALIITPLLLKFKKYKTIIKTILLAVISSSFYFLIFRDDLNIFLRNFQDAWYSHGGNLGFKSLYYLLAIKYISIPLPRLWFLALTLLLGLFSLFLTLKSKSKVLIFSIWICYYFFIYKDVWEHHFVFLMSVFSLLAIQLKLTFKNILKRKNVILTISFLLIASPSIFFLQYFFNPDAASEPDNLHPLFTIIYHMIKIVGVMILYATSSYLILKKA